MNRRIIDRMNRRKDLQKSIESSNKGGFTTHAAKLMAGPLGGELAECTIIGHCRTFLFEFPASVLVTEEHVGHQVIYSHGGLNVAIVSNLPAYFGQDSPISQHYSIDVSLRAGVQRTYDNAIKQSSQSNNSTVPLFLVIQEYSEVSPTDLKDGQCFTIDECLNGEAMIEGGREGERAILAIRTIDSPCPDFHADMHVINVILAAVKVEQNVSSHIKQLYSCSCFVSSEGQAVYTLSPSMSAAGLVVSRLDTSDVSEKAERIGFMLKKMMSDSESVAMELFDSIVLDETKDDSYLRLWYLRLWQSVEDAGSHLGSPQTWNDEKLIAGKKTLKELKSYRNDIAHWHTGRINFSCLDSLQDTAMELIRRKYGVTRAH